MPGFAPPQPQHGQHAQHVQALIWWPAADSAKLRAAAHAWRDVAKALDGVRTASQSAALNVGADNSGPAIDAFSTYWQKWSGSSGYLPSCAEGCVAMADALDQYAAAVDSARRQVEQLVAEVAGAVVIGAVLMIVTAGISEVAAISVSSALIASAAAVGVELTTTAAGIITTLLGLTAFGTIQAVATDAVAVQAERILIFHDQKDFNWNELLQSGEVGAATGFVGAIGGYVLMRAAARIWIGIVADGVEGSGGRVFVFWSGGDVAKDAATGWATANDGITFGMTHEGQALTAATQGMDWTVARPMWAAGSLRYAKMASGDIHLFRLESGFGPRSIWVEVEQPNLTPKVTSIIPHVLPG